MQCKACYHQGRKNSVLVGVAGAGSRRGHFSAQTDGKERERLKRARRGIELNLTLLQERAAKGDKILNGNSNYDMSTDNMSYLLSLNSEWETMSTTYSLGVYMGMKYQQRQDAKKHQGK